MLSIAPSASCCKTHKHGSMVDKEKTALNKRIPIIFFNANIPSLKPPKEYVVEAG